MILFVITPDLFAQSSTASANSNLAAAMDKVAADVYKPDIPGAAIIVVRNGQVIFRKGYGIANLELNVSIRPEMVFRLGSITKQFTAVIKRQKKGRGFSTRAPCFCVATQPARRFQGDTSPPRISSPAVQKFDFRAMKGPPDLPIHALQPSKGRVDASPQEEG